MSDTAEDTISRIDRGLQRWWAHCQMESEYDSLFKTYFEGNGFDSEQIEEELASDLSETQLLDFLGDDLDDFPFADIDDCERPDEWKKQFIFDLIRKLNENPDLAFHSYAVKFDESFFKDVQQKQVTETCKVYEEQCPIFWNQGMAMDSSLIQVLAIGRVHSIDFLSDLADDFCRWRVKKLDPEKPEELNFGIKNWSDPQNHPHFKKLEGIKVTVWNIKGDGKAQSVPTAKQVPYHHLAETALQSYFKRVIPNLMFNPMTAMNSSLEAVVQYIDGATAFIGNLLSMTKGLTDSKLCPFQFDLSIAVGEPKVTGHKVQNPQFGAGPSDDAEDDPDDDDDEAAPKYIDYVGDILAKLKANELRFERKEAMPGDPTRKLFQQLLHELSDKKEAAWLHRKRVIALVDRRQFAPRYDPKKEAKDTVFMYEPPLIARDIPKDELPEWYIGASKLCILPDMEFGDGSQHILKEDVEAAAEQKVAEDVNKRTEQETAERFTNIGVGHDCSGALLTVSFHVKQENVVKAYLCCNGQSMRFMPEDIGTVLPLLFNMDYGANSKFFRAKHVVDGFVKSMRGVLKDDGFEGFVNAYGR